MTKAGLRRFIADRKYAIEAGVDGREREAWPVNSVAFLPGRVP